MCLSKIVLILQLIRSGRWIVHTLGQANKRTRLVVVVNPIREWESKVFWQVAIHRSIYVVEFGIGCKLLQLGIWNQVSEPFGKNLEVVLVVMVSCKELTGLNYSKERRVISSSRCNFLKHHTIQVVGVLRSQFW